MERSKVEEPQPPSLAIPGVPPPPVELLKRLALVMPQATGSRLRGNHLQALGAFLDLKFRKYDFRRGAADAKKVVEEVLEIPYTPRDADFYLPDNDDEINEDIPDYSSLDHIESSRHPGKSVRQVFEEHLFGRLNAIVNRIKSPRSE